MAVMEPTKSSIDQDTPLYQSINEELSCKYKGQQKPYEELLVENIPLRIGEDLLSEIQTKFDA